MSTAGKVLTVLVILSLLGSIFVYSQVAQLNSNWGKEIQRLSGEVERLEQSIDETTRKVELTLAETTLLQSRRDRESVVLRARLSDVEKLQALTQESLVRAQQQAELLTRTIQQAQKTRDDRAVEVQQTQKALADTRSEVESLKEQVGDQMNTLQGLRDQFLALHAENEKLVERLRGGDPDSDTPPESPAAPAARTRSTSLISR